MIITLFFILMEQDLSKMTIVFICPHRSSQVVEFWINCKKTTFKQVIIESQVLLFHFRLPIWKAYYFMKFITVLKNAYHIKYL